nr:MAG TPA: hypothetical protein [Caudoviricetes sp.]
MCFLKLLQLSFLDKKKTVCATFGKKNLSKTNPEQL